jgi:hypothetical protein
MALEDRLGGMDGGANLCLVSALQSLGVPVQASAPGPYWALSDGNTMLRPFAKHLQHVAISTVHCGHYVLWCPSTTGHGHFTGMVITPSSVVVHDGDTKAVFGCVADVGFSDGMVVYKLVPNASTPGSSLADSQLAVIEINRETAL